MIRPHMVLRFALLAVCMTALTASPVAAQGKSQDAHGKRAGQTRPGGGPTTPSPGNPSPAVVSLASWLDDASTLKRHESWLGVSVARWSTDTARVWFAPSTFLMMGLTDRIGAGASVPIYHVRDTSGATAHGIGDVTIFGKVGLMQPETHSVGLALSPVVVAFEDPVSGGRRAAWALPVSLEARMHGGRVYGSAGYFSTNVAFFNGAAEMQLGPSVAVSGTLGGAVATRADAAVAGSRHRADISGSLAMAPAPNLLVSFSVGRSFSGDGAIDGGPWIAVSVAMRPARR